MEHDGRTPPGVSTLPFLTFGSPVPPADALAAPASDGQKDQGMVPRRLRRPARDQAGHRASGRDRAIGGPDAHVRLLELHGCGSGPCPPPRLVKGQHPQLVVDDAVVDGAITDHPSRRPAGDGEDSRTACRSSRLARGRSTVENAAAGLAVGQR